jgi:beta-N-acetylhexosaminidase
MKLFEIFRCINIKDIIMKKIYYCLILTIFLFSCGSNQDTEENHENDSSLSWELTPGQREWVEETFNDMTVEEKIGQLIAPAVGPSNGERNAEILEQVTDWINTYKIGHVYVASSKMDPVKTARLINDMQRASPHPLLIHSDLECGPGTKFDGGTVMTWPMGVAQTRSEELAYDWATITAKEARAIGIHLINSPVLDVNINADNPVINVRSFGDNPNLVTRMGSAFYKGLNDHGLIGAAKHFPGHGDVAVDSHSRMPTIFADRERLDSVEFRPYRTIIPEGLKSIMTAHISIPSLDPTPDLPATLSKIIMTDVLRDELGFQGLLITDAFDMGGILGSGTFEEAATLSLLAGNDIVLLWTNPRFETVVPYLLNAVESGRISQKHLDTSVRRNLEMKARLGLLNERYVSVEDVPSKVGSEEHQTKGMEIYEKAVVLVKNKGGIVPLEGKSISIISLNDDDGHPDIGNTFIREMRSHGNIVSAWSADPGTSIDGFAAAKEEAQSADVIVVGLFVRIMARRGSAGLVNEHMIQFLNELAKEDTPVFVVSFGSPYLISQFPEVDGYMICSEPSWEFYGYDKQRPGQETAAKALYGESEINGKLAVTIPELYPFGHGIRLKKIN